jgi:hypothetical protein
MNADLIDTLKALPNDPSRAVDLYPQLYAGTFLLPVKASSEASLGTALFLTYPCADGLRELPLFTSKEFVLKNLPEDVVFITASGTDLWQKLIEVLKPGGVAVAVDPGQTHGIRLHENMILGILSFS